MSEGLFYKRNLVFKVKRLLIESKITLLNIQVIFLLVRRYVAYNYLLPCYSNPSTSEMFL